MKGGKGYNGFQGKGDGKGKGGRGMPNVVPSVVTTSSTEQPTTTSNAGAVENK